MFVSRLWVRLLSVFYNQGENYSEMEFVTASNLSCFFAMCTLKYSFFIVTKMLQTLQGWTLLAAYCTGL